MLIKCLLFLIVFFIIAILLGHLCTVCNTKSENTLGMCYVMGVFIMIAVFDVFALVLTFLRGNLSTLVLLWGCSILILIILETVFHRRELIQMFERSINRIKRIHPLMVVVILIIICQTVFVCVMWHSDADDATYIGQATSAYFSNSIATFEYETGTSITRLTTYHLSPIGVFWAMLGKIFGIHPAVIMHTLCPALLIPLCYVIYNLIGKALFTEKNKQVIFMMFTVVLLMFSNYSIRTPGTFMFFRIWQGKAFVCATIIPFIFYLCMNKIMGHHVWKEIIMLLVVSISACSVSGMGPILVMALLGIMIIKDLLLRRKLMSITKYIIAIIPCIVRAVLFFTY